MKMHLAVHLLLLLPALLVLSQEQMHPQPDKGNLTQSSNQETLATDEDSASLKIVPGNTDFALRLYHLLASESPGKNIFFSPISISAALAMLSLGTRADTQTELLQVLGFNLTEIPESSIHQGFQHLLHTLNLASDTLETRMGSALFLSKNLSPLQTFLNDTMLFYKSQLFHTNFFDQVGAAKLINDHVKKETQGKIENLVSELSQETMIVLVNFIYFKAVWEKAFVQSKTTTQNFHVDEHTTVQVPMMWQGNHHHWYLNDRYLPCSVLKMNYEGDAAAFFILPDQGKMEKIEEALTPEMLTRWNNLLQKRSYFYRKLELHLPKFSISGFYELDQILPKVGFTELFSKRANLSGITEAMDLKMSKSFHKAILDVNEVGTRAAAATALSAVFRSSQRGSRVLKFNRPFFLVIYSTRTHSILFLGRVINPRIP
ncbi:PREDICTED: kallistatin [Elephantulus edwardii]|uniref:kallistatin n=1 Tax=Elephantulus edwardii TaxID=28737 RepID=UPI0003F07447|nr:PREDICTED: kallistatin [Elephantulus edwardii]